MMFLFILMFSFLLASNPFIMSLILLLICFLLLLIMNSFSNWLNFVLCLIYLGGIMIIFMYVSSLLPNKKEIKSSFMNFLVLMILMMLMFKNYFYLFETSKFMLTGFFYSPILFKFWLIFLMFMLLVLIMISDFCKIFTSPMRMM